MKTTTLVSLTFLTLSLCGCGLFQDDNSVESKPSIPAGISTLALNKECQSFHADPELTAALEKGDLVQLKNALGKCATLDPKANALPDSISSVFAIPGLFDHSDADSLVIYLVENGGDSAARAFKTGNSEGLMAFATSKGHFAIAQYLLAKGYPAEPKAVYYAVLTQSKTLYDSLITKVDNLDSVVGAQGHVLAAICSHMFYVEKPSATHPYDWYFHDLLKRGAKPDPKYLANPATCPGNPTVERRKNPPVLEVCINRAPERFARMLIEAGAGPDIRYCFLGDSNVSSTLEAGHTFPASTRSPALGAYMDSVAVVRGQKVP